MKKPCRHRGRGALLGGCRIYWCGECGAIRRVADDYDNSFRQVGKWLRPGSPRYVNWWMTP